MRKITIIPLLILILASCGGGPYDPCDSKEDCDPEQTDGCLVIPGGPPAFCSSICKTASDCPEGPKGEAPRCIPVGAQQVCAI